MGGGGCSTGRCSPAAPLRPPRPAAASGAVGDLEDLAGGVVARHALLLVVVGSALQAVGTPRLVQLHLKAQGRRGGVEGRRKCKEAACRDARGCNSPQHCARVWPRLQVHASGPASYAQGSHSASWLHAAGPQLRANQWQQGLGGGVASRGTHLLKALGILCCVQHGKLRVGVGSGAHKLNLVCGGKKDGAGAER